ncbi:hypothetical protein ASZ90_020113 [hydrocarbon metagenome]|uniref:Uncharacterized protein n=1 Tax=hydrocarbon metagenome TaxID=938273 RepID=A0A0W8E210_9ZZZZ
MEDEISLLGRRLMLIILVHFFIDYKHNNKKEYLLVRKQPGGMALRGSSMEAVAGWFFVT